MHAQKSRTGGAAASCSANFSKRLILLGLADFRPFEGDNFFENITHDCYYVPYLE